MAPLQQALEALAARFAPRGWAASQAPTSVLAMTLQPSAGVEHMLFVNEPWFADLPCAPGVVALACTVNVHFPTLEDCINEALQRDPGDAGRQSLRLSLARLAPQAPPLGGLAYPVEPVSGAGLDALVSDFVRGLEPVRRRLATLDVLSRDALPPPGIDPWTWHLRRAAWLHLQGDAGTAACFLRRLHEQAGQWLAEENRPGTAAAGPRASAATQRAAHEALALAEALLRPRRRVIRLAPEA